MSEPAQEMGRMGRGELIVEIKSLEAENERLRNAARFVSCGLKDIWFKAPELHESVFADWKSTLDAALEGDDHD